MIFETPFERWFNANFANMLKQMDSVEKIRYIAYQSWEAGRELGHECGVSVQETSFSSIEIMRKVD